MKKFLILGLVLIQAVIANPIQFNFSDNSDNETGFELCEVDETGKEVVQVLHTVGSDENSFSLPLETVANKRVAVRAFNVFGYSGFTNVVEIGDKPQDPSKLIIITINVQIP